MNKFNMPERENEIEEIAFLDDLAGRRSFIRAEGKIFYVDPEGNKEESSEELVQSAIEKHGYMLSKEK